MEQNQLIPLVQCLMVDLKDHNNVNKVALHETGHVIVMYAFNMIRFLKSVSIKPTKVYNEVLRRDVTVDGLTDITDEYKAIMVELKNDILQAPINMHYGKDITNTIQLSKLESAKLYLPEICRLFGGGAICHYYNNPDDGRCVVDHNDIDTKLAGLGLIGVRDTLLPLVYQYLNMVFASLDLLIKAIYYNLVTYGSLNKDQVMQLIEEWEEYHF